MPEAVLINCGQYEESRGEPTSREQFGIVPTADINNELDPRNPEILIRD